MFGSYRLLLALVVAASHMGLAFGDYHPGVMAVMGFYLLAGYIAVPLWEKAVKQADRQQCSATWVYWRERFWRLMPPYWITLALTALLMPILPDHYFLQDPLDFSAWLQNITVFPLAYYPLTGIDRITLIPPAWSLAVEFHFYLLVPFLLRLSKMWLNALWLISFGIWLLSFSPFIDAELWGYRYFAGMLFVFLTGQSLWYGHRQQKNLTWQAQLLLLSLLVLGILMVVFPNLIPMKAFRVETIIGLFFTLLLLIGLGRLPRQGWDDQIGKSAYWIFLSHFLIYWLFLLFLTKIS